MSDRKQVIVLSSRLDEAARLRRAFAADEKIGPRFFAAFEFVGEQAIDLPSAERIIAVGGAAIQAVFVHGRVALSWTKKDVESLFAASPWRAELWLVGIADDAAQLAHLRDKLGIRTSLIADSTATDYYNQMAAALKDARERITQRTGGSKTSAAPQVIQNIVERINVNPDSGYFPSRAKIVVHATKGGAGKSLIASNIAYGLALSGKKVILMDLNPDGGHIHRWYAHYLKASGNIDKKASEIQHDRGLTHLLRARKQIGTALTAAQLASFMVEFEIEDGQKLTMLSGIRDQNDFANSAIADMASRDNWLNELITIVENIYDYVVIDTGTSRTTTFGRSAVAMGNLLFLIASAEDDYSSDSEVDEMKSLMNGDDGRNKVTNIETATRILIVNKLQDPQRNPYARRLTDVVREFEFIGAKEIIPIYYDRDGVTISKAQRSGKPVIAMAAESVDQASLPLVMAIKQIVNVVRGVYGSADGDVIRPGGKKSSGGFISNIIGGRRG